MIIDDAPVFSKKWLSISMVSPITLKKFPSLGPYTISDLV